MKIKISEPQRKALKYLDIGGRATHVKNGRLSRSYWNRVGRDNCTVTMRVLEAKGLVEFVKREGGIFDHDIVLTEAGRTAIK